MTSINNTKITPEQRSKLILDIETLIVLREKQLAIFERNAKKVKRIIKRLREVQQGKRSLEYFRGGKQLVHGELKL